MRMIKKGVIGFVVFLTLVSIVFAGDVAVWQGQYFTGTTFNTGTFEFNFTIYDAQVGGGCAILTQPL